MKTMSPSWGKLAASVALTAALAACATKPPPAPAPTPAPPPPPAPVAVAPPPAPRPAPVGPKPGSLQDFVVNAGERVYFDFDQYAIRADGKAVLAAQAAWLNRYSQVAVRVEGNCDERGTRDYNLALGARRAEAIKTYLIAQGVAASRITTISYGKEQPVDSGTGEDAWAHNRNGHTALTGGVK